MTAIAPYKLLLLGGREGSKPMPLSEYYILDLKKMHWYHHEVPKPAPKNRYAHSAVVRASQRQILVFAGHGGRSRYYNDIAVLQLPGTRHLRTTPVNGGETLTSRTQRGWFRRIRESLTGIGEEEDGRMLSPAPEAPAAGGGGGRGDDRATGSPVSAEGSQPASLARRRSDTETSGSSSSLVPDEEGGVPGATWIFPEVRGTPPPKRSGHATAVVGQHAFIIGGFNGKAILQDVHCLNLETLTWSTPRLGGAGLPPLVGHSSVTVPNTHQIVVFGGSCSPNAFATGIDIIDTDVLASTPFNPPMAPQPRFWHRCAVVGNDMICFGGSGERGGAFNDVHALDLSPLVEGRMTEVLALASESNHEDHDTVSTRSRKATAPSMAVGLGGVGRLSEDVKRPGWRGGDQRSVDSGSTRDSGSKVSRKSLTHEGHVFPSDPFHRPPGSGSGPPPFPPFMPGGPHPPMGTVPVLVAGPHGPVWAHVPAGMAPWSPGAMPPPAMTPPDVTPRGSGGLRGGPEHPRSRPPHTRPHRAGSGLPSGFNLSVSDAADTDASPRVPFGEGAMPWVPRMGSESHGRHAAAPPEEVGPSVQSRASGGLEYRSTPTSDLAAIAAATGLTSLGVRDPSSLSSFHLAVPVGGEDSGTFRYVPLNTLLRRAGVSAERVMQVAVEVLQSDAHKLSDAQASLWPDPSVLGGPPRGGPLSGSGWDGRTSTSTSGSSNWLPSALPADASPWSSLGAIPAAAPTPPVPTAVASGAGRSGGEGGYSLATVPEEAASAFSSHAEGWDLLGTQSGALLGGGMESSGLHQLVDEVVGNGLEPLGHTDPAAPAWYPPATSSPAVSMSSSPTLQQPPRSMPATASFAPPRSAPMVSAYPPTSAPQSDMVAQLAAQVQAMQAQLARMGAWSGENGGQSANPHSRAFQGPPGLR